MSTLPADANNFLGLIELDAAGTVLYSKFDGDAKDLAAAADICGSNYYTEVTPFANIAEFRERVARFAESDQPADSFTFDCRCHGGEVVPVRVLLARMRQSADGDPAESLLVHIRKI